MRTAGGCPCSSVAKASSVDRMARRAKGDNYTDDERLEMFMDSFHALSQTSFWPEIRKLGRVDIFGKIEFTQPHGSAEAFVRQSRMDPMQAQLAGAYVRKYLTGADPISIDKVFASVEKGRVGPSEHLAEVRFQWEQVASKPFKFIAENGEVVVFVVEFPEDWTRVKSGIDGNRYPVTLTLRDFSTVFFYDGFLHAKDHRKDEGNRPLVRSIPQVLQTLMSHMAISGSLYAATILHWLISEAESSWCPRGCQERAIMQSLKVDGSTE